MQQVLERLSADDLAWLDRATARLALLESKEACEASLIEFVRQAWHVLEPAQPYVHGWVVDAICQHLEAVTTGEITRLLINVPPGFSKSIITGVLWPSWIWGPRNRASARFVGTSYAEKLAIRDATKMRRLVTSDWYQDRWGDRVQLTRDQNAKLKFENKASGFREAAAAGSLTGSRGDFLLIDDPHSVESAGSEQMRSSTTEWFLEAVPTRLNNPKTSAIVVIMQRLHEEDVSGLILSKGMGYEHLCLPMRFDADRRCETSIGFVDDREDGELLFPERFPEEVVSRDEKIMGPYATAGQFQQSPEPRGGGIIKRDWWQPYEGTEYPPFEFVLGSVDTAYGEKQENDYSAMTLWGVFLDEHDNPKVLLIKAWQERLAINALVERVYETTKRYKCDRLLIEAKASGISVQQELRRLYGGSDFSVTMINPGRLDKVARAHAVAYLFAEGLIYAPTLDGEFRKFAQMVIDQCAVFPRSAHDDLVDSAVQGIAHIRQFNYLVRAPERFAEEQESITHVSGRKTKLYPV